MRKSPDQTILLTTTPVVEGFRITEYSGIVTAEAFVGTNIFKEIVTGIRDVLGGRAKSCEKELKRSRMKCLDALIGQAQELEADAVINVVFCYSMIGQNGSMLLVNASGTAVCLEEL